MNTECFVLFSRLLQILPRAFLGFLTVVPFSVTSLKQVEISFVAVSERSGSDNSNSFNQLKRYKIQSKLVKRLKKRLKRFRKRFIASGRVSGSGKTLPEAFYCFRTRFGSGKTLLVLRLEAINASGSV